MLQDKVKEIFHRVASLPAGFIIYKNGSYANVTVTPVPNTTYVTQYYTPFNDDSWNFGNMAPHLFSLVGDFFGQPIGNQIVYGTIAINIIGIIWFRQESAAVPLFLLWTLSAIIFGLNLIPADWIWFIAAVQFIVLGGIAYTLFRGRRNS